MTHLSPIAGLGPLFFYNSLIRLPEDDTTPRRYSFVKPVGNIAHVVAKTGNYIYYMGISPTLAHKGHRCDELV